MARDPSNVISIDSLRASRQIHSYNNSQAQQDALVEGARNEFRLLIGPAIRRTLTAKGFLVRDVEHYISQLAALYAQFHLWESAHQTQRYGKR